MHMTPFIGSYANPCHTTNGLLQTPSHKPHVDHQCLTPIVISVHGPSFENCNLKSQETDLGA